MTMRHAGGRTGLEGNEKATKGRTKYTQEQLNDLGRRSPL